LEEVNSMFAEGIAVKPAGGNFSRRPRISYALPMKILLAFASVLFLVSLFMNGSRLLHPLSHQVRATTTATPYGCRYNFVMANNSYTFQGKQRCPESYDRSAVLWANEDYSDYTTVSPLKSRLRNGAMLAGSILFLMAVVSWLLTARRRALNHSSI